MSSPETVEPALGIAIAVLQLITALVVLATHWFLRRHVARRPRR